MAIVEYVENIIGKVEDASKVQTLIFSATMPNWVKKIASRFLKPDISIFVSCKRKLFDCIHRTNV